MATVIQAETGQATVIQSGTAGPQGVPGPVNGTFDTPIIQTPGAGANNETPFAQYGDLFSDAIVTTPTPIFPTSATLSSTAPALDAYVLGQRVAYAGGSYTVGASATSYLDLSNTGALTVSTSGTVTANSLRLATVTSSATAITAVAPIALQGSPYIKFRAFRGAGQGIASNSETTIALDTIAYNPQGTSLLQSNGTIQVPIAGYYHIDGSVGLVPTASGTDNTANIIIQKNYSSGGESIFGNQLRIDGVLGNANMAASGIMHLTPTDVLSLMVYAQLATTLFLDASMNFLSVYGPL